MEQKNTMEEFFDEEIGNYHDESKVILRIKHLMPGSRVLFSSFIFLGFFLGPQIASATTNQLILFEKNKNELSLIPSLLLLHLHHLLLLFQLFLLFFYV